MDKTNEALFQLYEKRQESTDQVARVYVVNRQSGDALCARLTEIQGANDRLGDEAPWSSLILAAYMACLGEPDLGKMRQYAVELGGLVVEMLEQLNTVTRQREAQEV